MKKLLTLVGILLVSLVTNAQLTVNQAVTTPSPYKVGDTIIVKYTVAKGVTKPRYFWLRYQFNNKALAYVSTTFTQGSSSQTFYTDWSAYKFTANAAKGATELYEQYKLTPWAYTVNSDWNVGQLTVQRTDASIDAIIATQKYIIKDLSDYTNIHKLDLSYSIDDVSARISPISTTTGLLSLTNVIGNTSAFKVRVLFPSGYNIAAHSVQLMPLKTDGSGDIDFTKQPLQTKVLDASGEATFTSGVKVGDSIGVYVAPASNKDFMNNIVTVTDAYKAFLAVSNVGLDGNSNYFTHPVREQRVGNISKDNDNIFSETDAYYLFSSVMGIDMSTKSYIPYKAMTSYRWESALLNQGWLDGINKNKVLITAPFQSVDAVYAWGGDLDFSHSSNLDTIANRVSIGNFVNSVNPANTIRSMAVGSLAYAAPVLEKATLNLSSTLINGKVELTAALAKADLAGLEVIMQYDTTKLTLDNVIFDAGNTVTNFSTHNNGRLTFGSIDQMKTARIKTGIPYKLIFTPKESLTNTAGLFFTVLSDAVDANGNKIELIVE
jgi:hypothetical protein